MYRVRRRVAQIQGREGGKSRKDKPGSRLEVAGGVSRGWETAGWWGCVEAVFFEELAEGEGLAVDVGVWGAESKPWRDAAYAVKAACESIADQRLSKADATACRSRGVA